jgi:hypothetical protein
MANNKKNTPYLTSPDKSFIAPSLSDEQIAAQEVAKAYRQHERKTSDDVAFDSMQKATPGLSVMEADKTRADLLGYKADKSTADVHKALMAAGMTPAYGNVADIADAVLYALEGEFGQAGWSAASAVPVIGQMVAGKRALKVAKEAGEEMVTLYRGIKEWHPSKHMLTSGKHKGKIVRTGESMVSDGKFVGSGTYRTASGQLGENDLWVSSSIDEARHYLGGGLSGRLLEFEVPKSYFKKHFKKMGWSDDSVSGFFPSGIPVPFLKKVHIRKTI